MQAKEARVAHAEPFSLNIVLCGCVWCWSAGRRMRSCSRDVLPLLLPPLLVMCVRHQKVLTHIPCIASTSSCTISSILRYRRYGVIWCMCQYLDTKHYSYVVVFLFVVFFSFCAFVRFRCRVLYLESISFAGKSRSILDVSVTVKMEAFEQQYENGHNVLRTNKRRQLTHTQKARRRREKKSCGKKRRIFIR